MCPEPSSAGPWAVEKLDRGLAICVVDLVYVIPLPFELLDLLPVLGVLIRCHNNGRWWVVAQQDLERANAK